ncbi:apolipoprotein N-acyltransferase [Coxiella endosymbiont of Ornithodoros maritimus]|uniref:apolipoprotein N-acyltransferase n=1 Tax=Coxiella endosymbiont of Ornithodoros maritimus TaxID=1656172 RepID=UPI0022645AF2|nr:apolipoprotein N-acyltransferase [Coxiella endosymbiont of Ornithodoros maritimus]
MNSVLALITGVILPLAFAPFNWFPIAFISPTILLAVWLRSRPLVAWWRGCLFGFGFFGVGASWIYVSIHHFGNANVPLAVLITVLFVFILALFVAFQGLSFSLLFRKRKAVLTALFAFPAWWVVWEWLRSILFTGFPWLFLGYSQINSPLKGFGPLFGIYDISLIVAFISGCIYLLVTSKKLSRKIMCLILIILPFIVGWVLTFIPWAHPGSESVQVGLVQGNIGQRLKWDSDTLYSTLHTYYSETQKNWNNSIIVWPEAAIPIYPQQASFFLQSMDKEAKQHNTALITGIPIYHEKTNKVFNGLMILGDGHGLYLKRHLVPFGESFTSSKICNLLMKYFDIPMSNLSPGPEDQEPTVVKAIPFAPFICYEIAYPNEVLNHVSNKQFIVVVSDDSWFAGTIAPVQQLQIAQMRALETERYLLYSTNTGITAIISPEGKIVKSAPQNQRLVLNGQIKPVTGKTPLMSWNYYPVVGIIIVFLLLTFL